MSQQTKNIILIFENEIKIMHKIFIYNILRNLNFINEQFIHCAQNHDCVKFNVIVIKKEKKLFDVDVVQFFDVVKLIE